MDFKDLKNLLIFAKEMNLMKESITKVLQEWDAFWDDYFCDLEADYWISEQKMYL